MTAPLIIITGPPGVGKSTAAEALAGRFDRSAVVGGDWFLDNLRDGKIDPWLPEAHHQDTEVMRITVRTARHYARADYTTVLEGIIGPWFLDLVRDEVGGMDAHYAILDAPLEVCLRRVRQRGRSPVETVAAKMHAEFTDHARPDRMVSADRPTEAVVADLEARVASGDLRL